MLFLAARFAILFDMTTNDTSLNNQKNAFKAMKSRQSPLVHKLAGNDITALPNVYEGWLDSELMCDVIEIPAGERCLTSARVPASSL